MNQPTPNDTSLIRYLPHQIGISDIDILPSIAWACMVNMLISFLKNRFMRQEREKIPMT